MAQRVWGRVEQRLPPSPPPYLPADFKDDVTAILLLGVSFLVLMHSGTSEDVRWRFEGWEKTLVFLAQRCCYLRRELQSS
jgi:hypothetical protein